MAVRVGFADDSFLIREALTRLLGGLDEIELVAVCADADELRGRDRARRPDVVLPTSGCRRRSPTRASALAAELRGRHPEVGVVVLSASTEPAYALALLEDGSEGRAYLLKDRVQPRQLLAAIETVAAGGSVIDPKVVDALVAARAQAALAARVLTPARARGPGRDGPGREQRRHRRHAEPDQARRREAHQLDLRQARPAARPTTSAAASAPSCSSSGTPQGPTR